MMQKVKYGLLLYILMGALSVSAQDYVKPDTSEMLRMNRFGTGPGRGTDRLSFSVDFGVGVGTGRFSSGYAYIAPFLGYRISPRFRLDAGAMYIQSLNGMSSYGCFGPCTRSALTLFVRGNYLMTERLMISGSVYKTFDLNQQPLTDFNSNRQQFNNYGFSVGFDYKISEHMTIGAGVSVSDGSYNPMVPSGFYPAGSTGAFGMRPPGNFRGGW